MIKTLDYQISANQHLRNNLDKAFGMSFERLVQEPFWDKPAYRSLQNSSNAHLQTSIKRLAR